MESNNLFFVQMFWVNHDNLGCPPAQDDSHHQDYDIFRIADPELNLHLPLLLGGGTTHMIINLPLPERRSF